MYQYIVFCFLLDASQILSFITEPDAASALQNERKKTSVGTQQTKPDGAKISAAKANYNRRKEVL